MALVLYAHPFSSYCQKVLLSLYENPTAFTLRMLGDLESFAELAALWPHKKMPVLTDGKTTVVETTVIIEYLAQHYPGPVKLIPEDPEVALEARFMDRFFDLYVMTPMQKVVGDRLRPEANRDPFGVTDARSQLEISYQWLDAKIAGRQWAAGDDFTLADCAAAPALFYADWVLEANARYSNLRAYRKRLLTRPSMARAVEEARPFRKFFPLGAPDRD